jgi:MoaA/NifB/PqqE/SkfB family radical SAM enzyme
MQQVSTNIKRIYLTGGEPTLIKENRTLLKNLIDSKNTNCFVSFTTNGTMAEGELLDLMSHFPYNEIQISIDGIGNEGNYIRHPLNWENFDSNFNLIAALPNIKIVVYSVISAYNIFSLPDIWEYLDAKAEYRPIGWYPIFLDNPNYMRTTIWDHSIRADAITKMQDAVKKLKYLNQYVGNEVFEKVYEYYRSEEYQPGKIKEFLEFNKLLDKHRGTDFSSTFLEILCRI